jgi:aflatoxin B1 aldehyde reductase
MDVETQKRVIVELLDEVKELEAENKALRLPKLHLGTMTFAWQQASSYTDDAVATDFVDRFMRAGYVEIDTARAYAGGDSEKMLGRVLKARPKGEGIVLATKAAPYLTGGLSPGGLRAQLKESTDAMQISFVDVYYLHQPDGENPLTESLKTMSELINEGLIGNYALSNYSYEETARTVEICQKEGYPLPCAFQGLYNAINRRVEAKLLPLLRAHGIKFVAFNPLAAGLLTGKHTREGEVKAGRFKDNSNYLDRFYKDDSFEALEKIKSACSDAGISMIQASYSWLMNHSALSGEHGDGVLLGASSVTQVRTFCQRLFFSHPISWMHLSLLVSSYTCLSSCSSLSTARDEFGCMCAHQSPATAAKCSAERLRRCLGSDRTRRFRLLALVLLRSARP